GAPGPEAGALRPGPSLGGGAPGPPGGARAAASVVLTGGVPRPPAGAGSERGLRGGEPGRGVLLPPVQRLGAGAEPSPPLADPLPTRCGERRGDGRAGRADGGGGAQREAA